MPDSNILLLTGGTGSGKTKALEEILKEMEPSRIKAGGILAPGRYLASGDKEFDLEIVPGRNTYFLSTRIQYPHWQAIGDFRFNPEAIEAGLKHLHSLPLDKYHLYLLDEIGPFELEGHLWAPAIPALLDKGVPMILTVRSRLIEQVCKKWGIIHPGIISLEAGRNADHLERIRLWLKLNVQESS